MYQRRDRSVKRGVYSKRRRASSQTSRKGSVVGKSEEVREGILYKFKYNVSVSATDGEKVICLCTYIYKGRMYKGGREGRREVLQRRKRRGKK
jgi:hypothetical protein